MGSLRHMEPRFLCYAGDFDMVGEGQNFPCL